MLLSKRNMAYPRGQAAASQNPHTAVRRFATHLGMPPGDHGSGACVVGIERIG